MDGQIFELGCCPLCGNLTFNGRCEDRDCHHHWHPVDDDENDEDQ